MNTINSHLTNVNIPRSMDIDFMECSTNLRILGYLDMGKLPAAT